MANNTEENVIDMIRQRTEEEELKQHLKTTVGGYTKNSVMEYLAEMRKHQQNSSQTFNQHMQTLLEEKESLKSENEKLLMQVAQAKAEFHRMADSRKQQEQSKLGVANDHSEAKEREPVRTELTNDNIVYLKSSTPAFDTADRNPQIIDSELEKKMEALKNEMFEKEAELDKSKQELKVHKELLADEKLEAKKLRDLVAELSAASEKFKVERQYLKAELIASVEQQDTIIAQLKTQVADKDNKLKMLEEDSKQINEITACMQQQEKIISQLEDEAAEKDYKIKLLTEENRQIAELTAKADQQGMIILQLTNEAADKENTVKILLDENITMMQSMELMSNSLDNMEIQNEKLVTANNALAQAFEDENKKVVKLINEKSEETVEKLILARKLEEIMGNISAYELSKSDKAEIAKETESKTSIA